MAQKLPAMAQAAKILREARRVVVFSGAGASAESGIPTFRDCGGLWHRFPAEQFATPHGFLAIASRNPKRAAEFVLALLEPIAAAEPNDGHRAIAALEQHAQVTVVTQNIDGLHQAAGSTAVQEVHGSVFNLVTSGGEPAGAVSRDEMRQVVLELREAIEPRFDAVAAMKAVRPILSFDSTGVRRPNIVLFGEAMAEPAWGQACAAVDACDCLLAVGTSGAVFPAAMLPEQAKSAGAELIAVGPERSGSSDVWLPGTAARMLPMLMSAAFGK